MKASLAWTLVPAILVAACCPPFCRQKGEPRPPTPPPVVSGEVFTDSIVLHREDVTTDTLGTMLRGPVHVTLNCATHPPTAQVDKYRLGVIHHDSVTWEFDGPGTFRIKPKLPAAWPFANAEPSGSVGHPAASGAMVTLPDSGTVIEYQIRGQCERTLIIIDPEIIILPH